MHRLTEAVRNAGADIAPTYQEYIQLAFAIATDCSEAGRQDFLTLCSFSPKYDPRAADKLFSNALKNGHNDVHIGTAFHLAELRGKRYLEKAAMITASVDVPLKQISRYDLNIASGIIHTAKEHGVTDVIIGLHRKVNIVDSFFGMLAENLLKGLHREVMIAKFLMPINTIRRINIAVPPKAEYEAGFQKWVEHFCRMGSTLGCRVHFFANEETTTLLQILVKKRFSSTMTDFSRLDDWGVG